MNKFASLGNRVRSVEPLVMTIREIVGVLKALRVDRPFLQSRNFCSSWVLFSSQKLGQSQLNIEFEIVLLRS